MLKTVTAIKVHPNAAGSYIATHDAGICIDLLKKEFPGYRFVSTVTAQFVVIHVEQDPNGDDVATRATYFAKGVMATAPRWER